MQRSGIWAACVVLVLLVGAGVLAVGAGYAKDDAAENAAVAKCSKATLDGQYLFAQDGVQIKGGDQVPFAIAGYEVFDGNGKVKVVASANFNGDVVRNVVFTGTYTVKANCTGTSTANVPNEGRLDSDLFIAPDGSMFTFVQTNPSQQVTSGFELQATAKRVGD